MSTSIKSTKSVHSLTPPPKLETTESPLNVSPANLRPGAMTTPVHNRASFSSINFNMSQTSKPGTRASMLSDYSGIVHHVDIDTVKYVGNKESLQLSGLASSSEESLDMSLNIADEGDTRHSPNLAIPTRSSKRDSAINQMHHQLDTSSMSKIIRNSPTKSIRGVGTPPRSPLPKLTSSHSLQSSPLKKKHYRRNSSDSDASLVLHGKLDDIMKEVESLKIESDDEEHDDGSKFDKTGSIKPQTSKAPHSTLSSTTNSIHTSNSYHTANEDEKERDDEASEYHFHSVDPSISTLKNFTATQGSSRESKMSESLSPPDLVISESLKSHEKKTLQPKSSTKHHHNHQSKNSNSTKSHKSKTSSSKSKRKSTVSTTSKNKIKPFSYDTLAKLLNATDGILIGQEFATLNIPAEEKFLIERIVDSISRLTANMMLNPARYDQSCARLEHVLNVLEGFD